MDNQSMMESYLLRVRQARIELNKEEMEKEQESSEEEQE
jgi:hypothetical protein